MQLVFDIPDDATPYTIADMLRTRADQFSGVAPKAAILTMSDLQTGEDKPAPKKRGRKPKPKPVMEMTNFDDDEDVKTPADDDDADDAETSESSSQEAFEIDEMEETEVTEISSPFEEEEDEEEAPPQPVKKSAKDLSKKTKVPSFDDVNEACMQAAKKVGIKNVADFLKKNYGTKSISGIDEFQYANVIKAISKL